MRLSVIIPTFQRASLVGEAVASVLAAAVPGMEVIVIDDGSTDDTGAVLAGFGDAITVIHQPNNGVSRARNAGIAAARGAFVKFVDSDDLVPPDTLGPMLANAEKAASDEILVGDIICFFGDGRELPGTACGYGYEERGSIDLTALLTGGMSTEIPLFPRRALEQVGGFDEAIFLGEEKELALRLIAAGWRFSRVPLVVAKVRMHDGVRLTGRGDAATYENLLLGYARMRAALDRIVAKPKGARVALARHIWVAARDAARDGHTVQAEALFEAARDLGGSNAMVGNFAMRTLYRIASPINAERFVQRVKRATRKLS